MEMIQHFARLWNMRFFGLTCLVGILISALPGTAKAEKPFNANIIDPTVQEGLLPDVPVVFASRNRLSNWKKVHIGPPVDVVGRELTPGGRLLLWRPGGTITDLTENTGLYDVQQPGVSFDGNKIAFSGVTGPGEQWHLWGIGVDGTGLRQLTFDDRDIPVPEDPQNPGHNERVFGRYGDFGPAYLPDNRIIFASTRYMTQSGSCGQRGQNLYVLDPETLTYCRRTTERAGAMDPFVLADGRVVFSHWIDAVNTPALDGAGLRPLETDYNFSPSSWGIWVMNPDASEAGRYAFLRGGLDDGGGAHQPHELADGRLVVSYRGRGSLLGDTLAGAVTLVTPGPVGVHKLRFLGNPFKDEGPHAIAPAPLPDGRIVVSFTPFAHVETDSLGIRSAGFDFGLYISEGTLDGLIPLYNDPETDELDAAAVMARSAPIIHDGPDADLVTDDPAIDPGTTATLVNHNVYADLPLDGAALPSPRVGTVAAIDVYDDSQTFTTSEEFPLLRKQMPRLIESFPVEADGSFTATIPADRPVLFVLVNQDGVAVRSPLSRKNSFGRGRWITHSFNGHDYLRPGTTINCSGCHKGHMFRPELVTEAKANLSRLAVATASSEPIPFYGGAWRVNDLRPAGRKGAFAWATDEGPGAWVELGWAGSVEVEKMFLYPFTARGSNVTSATLTMSDGGRMDVGPFPEDGTPLAVSFDPPHSINWFRFTVNQSDSDLVGLSELVVNGRPDGTVLPDNPPPTPVNLRTTDGVISLQWNRNENRTDEPAVAGYRVYYGVSSGEYDESVDVGNVVRFLMRDLLEEGQTYYMTLKSYNIYGTESESSSNEVMATVHAPVVTGIEPDHGPVGGGTIVTITGEYFAPRGVRVSLGGQHARGVRVIDENTLVAITHWHGPGQVAVEVSNPDDMNGVLADGFTYEALP